jgi:alpha-D-xyloside xylohydrolase
VIKTSRLIIKVDRKTNAITYLDFGEKLIASEDSDNKEMHQQMVAGIETYSCSTTFNSPANEALFGLGCHPVDSLSINYKGRNQDMAIKYMTGAIPVLLSTRGYGLMWDNYSASNFYGAEAENTKFKYESESGKQVDDDFFTVLISTI